MRKTFQSLAGAGRVYLCPVSQLPSSCCLLEEFQIRIRLPKKILQRRNSPMNITNISERLPNQPRIPCYPISSLQPQNSPPCYLSFPPHRSDVEMRNDSNNLRNTVAALPSPSPTLTVMVPFPAGDLFFRISGRVSFLLDTICNQKRVKYFTRARDRCQRRNKEAK